MDWRHQAEPTGLRLTDWHGQEFARVAHLYDGQDPRRLETYQQRAASVLPRFTAGHRAQLVATLRAHMTALGAPAAALAQADRLLDPESVAVVTGQQAGLFTGPLYTVYKALTALGLARRLEAELGRPVVPVFWIAAEDHDWAEVDHVYVLDRQDELVRLRLPAHGMPHQMVHAIQLQPAAVEQVLQEAYARLPDAPDKAELLRTLQAAWRPGDTLANWFARLLWRWVAPHGLVVLNPCWPGLRELAAPVWEHTLAHLDHVQAELEAAYAAVAATGASPEVVRDTTHSTVFYVDERGRRFVLEDTGRGSLRARGLGVEQPVATWLALARECPESFSANVLLRPVVQDHLLPTLAYVGGPSEIAYHPLARGVFRVHERNLPPLVLRDRLQWYPPEVLRNLEKWRLPLHELDCTPRDLTTSVLADLGGERVTAAAVDLATTAAAAWGRFADALRDLGPQVDSIVRAQRRREQAGMERAVRKVQRLLEQRHETALRQLRHIERWLWTDGHPQERRLSPLNVWSRYGWSWLVELPFWGDYRAPLGVYHVLERGLESDVVGVETEGSAT